ncbi:MAG: hypothetical protein COB37_09900 [Kordiimonadales bacterium]|nr:MAG: hypothetical protein COB37_09900 [Kordiimonadales bacterium]
MSDPEEDGTAYFDDLIKKLTPDVNPEFIELILLADEEFEKKLKELLPRISNQHEFLATMYAVSSKRHTWLGLEHSDPHNYLDAVVAVTLDNEEDLIIEGEPCSKSPWSVMAASLINGLSYE